MTVGGVLLPGATSGLEFAMLERKNMSLLYDCFIRTELPRALYIHTAKRMRSNPLLNTAAS